MADILDCKDYYTYLRTQFSDLEGAKRYMRHWHDDLEQEDCGGGMTTRAMSAHCSLVLEGYEDDSAYVGSYMTTKHGTELANALWMADKLKEMG